MPAERTATPGSEDTAGVALSARLRAIVGRRHLLIGAARTRRYRHGIRFGSGEALAVARPATLVEMWRVLQACVDADAVVIMQAANTGLTGGSTPHGDDYNRPVVIVSTGRLRAVHLIDEGRQVICLPGATLHSLEQRLAPIGREPHSVIGSSCIGASVIGGVCNNSGGALVQRGPAFTEFALFARVSETGEMEIVNHLGIVLPDAPEAMLAALEQGDFTPADIAPGDRRRAHDRNYARHVRDIDAPTPARFNADPARLFEASGSAGRIAVFAVRLDTFVKPARRQLFYIGANDAATLTALRRHILARFAHLPVSGEYIHRDAYAVAERYGKDSFLLIKWLGTQRLPWLFALKARIDGALGRLGIAGPAATDRMLQALSHLTPPHLPRRMDEFHRRFEHHLLLEMAGEGIDEARAHLDAIFPAPDADVFVCTPGEARSAYLHRFAVASAATRYQLIHRQDATGIVAFDIALPRNCEDWYETLPEPLDDAVLAKLYYGHFFCHVFHQDYIVAKGHDVTALKLQLAKLFDRRGAEYPAEHNVGHQYRAKPELSNFYRRLDPGNRFNPGIGQTSRARNWSAGEAAADPDVRS